MAFLFQQQNSRRNMALFGSAASLALFGVFAAAARPDNPSPGDSVGAIEGEAIAVTGPMSVENLNGSVATVLHSGSDVRVKSGSARINLVEGGADRHMRAGALFCAQIRQLANYRSRHRNDSRAHRT